MLQPGVLSSALGGFSCELLRKLEIWHLWLMGSMGWSEKFSSTDAKMLQSNQGKTHLGMFRLSILAVRPGGEYVSMQGCYTQEYYSGCVGRCKA